jgi:hypothetical protein
MKSRITLRAPTVHGFRFRRPVTAVTGRGILQNYQTEDYPQGEQFYTDALSVLALSAIFAPQHGERK